MRLLDSGLLLSASDLTAHHACAHLTHLELLALHGGRTHPEARDAMTDLLAHRGDEHERRHLESLRAQGLSVIEMDRPEYEPVALRLAEQRTLAAMRSGADVIYQATFFDGRRAGFADFLRRVERPSDLGDHSYEVHDTKLAGHVKVEAILQVCEYSDHVARLQGVMPEEFALVLGDGTEARLRLADHISYYRAMRARLDGFVSAWTTGSPSGPEPCAHCDICSWKPVCNQRWRDEDSLVLVAGIRSSQRQRLRAAGVTTVAGLAAGTGRIPSIAAPTLQRLRDQARLQVAERTGGEPIVELIDSDDERGLASLPEPSPGDIFFDIEGDPLWPDGGLEYLLGVAGWGEGDPPFQALWAHDRDAEQAAFEEFIDAVMERRRRDPAMHIYHYAPYEVTAVKRLAARHGTREAEVDILLRGEVFVDLYRVIRHGILVSKESYSLKSIETFFMPHRDGEVANAATSVVEYERWLTTRDEHILTSIEDYNRFDCVATARLRDWLEGLRHRAETEWGRELTRPAAPEDEPPERVAEDDAETAALIEPLLDRTDLDATPPGHREARELLAHLLGFHRREDRSHWWAYFERHELSMDELVADPECIGAVRHLGPVTETATERNPRAARIHRFGFDPAQEHKVRADHEVIDPTRKAKKNAVGTVVDIAHGHVDIKLKKDCDPARVRALFPWAFIGSEPLKKSLRRFASCVIQSGIDGSGEWRASRDLVMRRPPRLRGGPAARLVLPGETPDEAAVRLVTDLDGGVLAIQGPPGAGKTHTAAAMAAKVLYSPTAIIGITAPAHRTVAHLLQKVLEECAAQGISVSAAQRCEPGDHLADERVTLCRTTKDVPAAIARGARIVAGTAWCFASEGMSESVDVLFVDEAGQMSLASTLAAASAARNLVLLGDPQQLPQVLTGSHPDGAGASALEHLLGGHDTMPPSQGLFLDATWRMHPAICSFVSTTFYESRLHARPLCEVQNVDGSAGLRFVPVDHTGRTGRSPEEADAVAALVRRLLDGGKWTPREGPPRPLTEDDIVVVTPFNAQVELLRRTLPPGVAAGTVDKFQGKEAAVAIYSMACSSAEDAPRGIAFLYELNRLNVAVSRARALACVVASPRLLEARCTRPEQVPRVNALCRFVELAESLAPGAPPVRPAVAGGAR